MLKGGAPRGEGTYEKFTFENGRRVVADVNKLRDDVRRAMRYGWSQPDGGRRVGPDAWHWEVNSAGDCEAPVVFRAVAHVGSYLEYGEGFPDGCRHYFVTYLRRCRQCSWCKMMRSCHWSHRAETEYGRNQATWLGTITLSPAEHCVLDAKVAARAHKTGASWMTDWTPERMFKERCLEMGELVRLWLKRTRVNYKRAYGAWPRFSYLLVAEAHQSGKTSEFMVGRPHYHILVHEPWFGALFPVREHYVTALGRVRLDDQASIRADWKLGFTQFELCRDVKSASYLCKYLSKAMLWRVRASKRYGKDEKSVVRASVSEAVAASGGVLSGVREAPAAGADQVESP